MRAHADGSEMKGLSPRVRGNRPVVAKAYW